jgi:Tfp pilus assembly protein PilN
MALHLNLYHEIQKQHRARKRDPLKLGMYALGAVMLGFLGYYFLRVAQVSETASTLVGVQADWQALEPKQKAAAAREAEISANAKLTESLVQQIEGRYYWGPILERIMQTVPAEVQLTRLEANRAADKAKKVSVMLNGISTGAEPRQTAEDLRTALEQGLGSDTVKVTSAFKQLEDSEDKAQLRGQALPTATFTIQIELAKNEPGASAPSKREAKK